MDGQLSQYDVYIETSIFSFYLVKLTNFILKDQ